MKTRVVCFAAVVVCCVLTAAWLRQSCWHRRFSPLFLGGEAVLEVRAFHTSACASSHNLLYRRVRFWTPPEFVGRKCVHKLNPDWYKNRQSRPFRFMLVTCVAQGFHCYLLRSPGRCDPYANCWRSCNKECVLRLPGITGETLAWTL